MTTPLQSIEEYISISCIGAIVSRAGATYDVVNRDFGVDITVRRVDSLNGKRMDMGGVFDCQLKATINWGEKDNHVIYDLDSETYNKLLYRRDNSTTPCFLLVMCLPKDIDQWVEVTEDMVKLRKCCYYFAVDGKPTSNKSSIRIKIPRNQLLTPQVIISLISKISKGEML